MALKMKQRTTKIRRYLVNKLGGKLKEDYMSSHYPRVTHDIIKYNLYRSTLLMDNRGRVPIDVYKRDLVYNLAKELINYVTFTEFPTHKPHIKELRAELWVGKRE